MVEEVFKVSRIAPERSVSDTMLILVQEVGELAQEISIDSGFIKDKKRGEDGIIGEAIDVIQCALDIIWLTYPDITEAHLRETMKIKSKKWKNKFSHE